MEALSLFDAQLEPAAEVAGLPSLDAGPAPAPVHLRPRPTASAPRGPTLLALDGNALAHRAFHAYSEDGPGPRYGFLALFSAICDRVGPDAVIVGFDCREQSVRKAACAAYKANRPDKDPSLVSLLTELPVILDELAVQVVTAPGWEADDVIGSAATTAEAAGWRCVVATSDRDAFGLVSERTTVLRLRSGIDNASEVTPARLLRDLGVRPAQYVEFAALRGDTSDNLPGINGIGRRRAVALLAAYATVDEACADPLGCRSVLGPRLGQALLDDVASPASVFRRNVELMTIRRDLPIDLDGCRRRTSAEELARRLRSQGLPSLAARMAAAVGARPDLPPPVSDADAPPW